MKILQLFSDWKWTGPAEPAVSLCEALTREGIDVRIAFRKTPIEFPERTVEKQVKERGIAYHDGFRLNRYFSPKDWVFDVNAISAYVEKEKIDIVHANLSHDHFTALFAFLFVKRKPLILRTDHKRDGLPYDPFMAWAFKRTDGLVTYSTRIMGHDVRTFRFPEDRTCVIPPGVKPFDGQVKDMRAEFGLKTDEMVIGVIGRLKPDRGYDVILKAFSLVKKRMARVKLVIVGRSSQIEKSIKEPLAELGLEHDVILAGYRIDDYFDLISNFDVFVMMRAGSDGSARALREVMAMGKAAIVSDKGMLPELVKDGFTGFVVKSDEHELADRLETILGDDEKRKTFGDNAKRVSSEEWSYTAQAQRLISFYDKLLTLKKGA
jgi:glycosyltransferase involved in cell wall biosynthesis